MNKFIKKFLEVGGILLVAAVIFAPALFAADDVNLYLKVYEDDASVSKVMTESDSEDKQKSKNRDGVANLVSAYKTMYGLDGAPKAAVAAAIESGELRPELRYGLVHNATTTYVSAFFYSPSVNVPNYYAEMLMPDMLKPSSSTAYAANASQQPDNNSASSYLQSMGINNLWGISFSLAMLMLVLVLMVAGFMIMFRSKAGGQTVVTITMALQNVVVGALLALASYAIGGIFLNISKYLILLIGTLFAGFMSDAGINVIYLSGPWNLTKDFFLTTVWGSKGLQDTATGAMSGWGDSIAQGWLGFTEGWQSQGTLVSFDDYVNALTAGLAGTAELVRNTISYPFVFMGARIILGGVILVAAIRIFWTVLSTYIKMIIDIVIAPLVFMISSLPGKQGGYTNWFNRMLKNSITVPIMFAFVNLAAYLALSVTSAQGGCSSSLITCISAGAIPVGQTEGTDWLFNAMGPGGVVAAVMLNMVPTMPAFIEDLFSGKSNGGPSKAWDGVKKNLQGLPVFGGLIQ